VPDTEVAQRAWRSDLGLKGAGERADSTATVPDHPDLLRALDSGDADLDFGPGRHLELGWSGGDRPEAGTPRAGRRARRLLVGAALAAMISVGASLISSPTPTEASDPASSEPDGEVGLIQVVQRTDP